MNAVDRSRLPAVAADPGFAFPAIGKRTLANGLELRAVEHHAVPLVSAAVLVRGGSASDPATAHGLTALTGDLLDERTDQRDALGIADAVARLGGELDIDVGFDSVVVSLTMLRRFAESGLALLAEVTMAPSLDGDDFARVRTLRTERLRQLRNHPPALAEQAFAATLYQRHPYAHLGLGDEAALARMSVDDVRGHYRGMFVPDGATLVIAGDFPAAKLLDLGEAAFATWAGDDRSAGFTRLAGLAEPPASIASLRLVHRQGAAQSELRIGQVCCARSTPDYFPLVVLNAVLGGQFVSRLNMNLREDKGFTYGVRTSFEMRRGRGPFVLQTSVQTEVTAAAIRESLYELAAIRNERPPTDEELALAKESLTRGYPRAFETVQGVGRAAAQLALHGLPDSYFADFTAKVQAVTREDVLAAAARHLDPGRMSIVIVGDSERVRSGLESLSIAPLELVA